MKFLNVLPKEEKFYDLLSQLASSAEKSAGTLYEYVANPQPDLRQRCVTQARESKALAKQVLRQTDIEVCRTFITPFDREDIQELATSLYMIPKGVDKILKRLELYHPSDEQAADLQRFCQLILRQSDQFTSLMQALIKGGKPVAVQEQAAVLFDLEDQGDELFNQLLAQLLDGGNDVKTIFMKKDLYELLEDVTDSYRDAASVGLRIILKHT
jgi:uncharacterized protein